jgi:hypothetical protein
VGKIYITGIGRVTPCGINQEDPEHVKQDSSIINIDEWKYETPFKQFKRLSRSTQISVLSTNEALKDAGIEGPFIKNSDEAIKTGLIVSTSYTNLESILLLHKDAENYGEKFVNPGIFPSTVLNSIAGQISILYSIQGVNITLSNGSHQWWKAFDYAQDLFTTHKVERLILCFVDLFPPKELIDVCDCSLPYESATVFVLEQESPSKESILLKLTSHPSEQNENNSNGLQTLIRKTKKMRRYRSLIEDKVIIYEGSLKHMLTIKRKFPKE